jgi:hypothetical protein
LRALSLTITPRRLCFILFTLHFVRLALFHHLLVGFFILLPTCAAFCASPRASLFAASRHCCPLLHGSCSQLFSSGPNAPAQLLADIKKASILVFGFLLTWTLA